MNQHKSTGYLYAFGASLALASSFVFSKSALNHLNMIQFGLIWFSLGVVWNGAWFLIKREGRNLKESSGTKTIVAIVIAVLEGAATGLFYLAIKEMENPAVVSFIGNIGPVFVTIMGMGFLKERFRGSQLLGIAITILGVFVINYREGGFAGFLDPGSIYVISASFLFSLATIFARKWRKDMVTSYMSLLRSLLLMLSMAILFIVGGEGTLFQLSGPVIRDLALGSFLETMIVIIFAYQALKMIEATRTSLIISSKGVWALILAWAFLGVFPTGFQLAGGVLTLAGVWLITRQSSVPRQE